MVANETQWAEVNGRWTRIPVTANTSSNPNPNPNPNPDHSPSSRETKQKPETVKEKKRPPPLPRRNRNKDSSPKKIEGNKASEDHSKLTASKSKYSSPPPGITKTNADDRSSPKKLEGNEKSNKKLEGNEQSKKKLEGNEKSNNRGKSTTESKCVSPPPGISKANSDEYNGLVQNGTRRFSTTKPPMKDSPGKTAKQTSLPPPKLPPRNNNNNNRKGQSSEKTKTISKAKASKATRRSSGSSTSSHGMKSRARPPAPLDKQTPTQNAANPVKNTTIHNHEPFIMKHRTPTTPQPMQMSRSKESPPGISKSNTSSPAAPASASRRKSTVENKEIVAKAKETLRKSLNLSEHGASLFRAKWEFKARTPLEITFKVNDIFRVIEEEIAIQKFSLKPETGWLVAEQISTRKVGYVALNYVVPISETEAKSLNIPLSSPQQHSPYANTDAAVARLLRPYSDDSLIPEKVQSLSHQPKPRMITSRESSRTIRSGSSATIESGSGSFRGFDDDTVYRNAETKHNGYATDVIAVKSSDGKRIFATPFNVRFTGSSGKNTFVGSSIDVKISGKKVTEMILRNSGDCTFRNSSKECDVDLLSSVESLSELGSHELIYEHKFQRKGMYRVNFVKANIWVFNYSDYILVSDIDGTITKSDVGGMMNTVGLGKMGFKQRGYAHSGICTFYRNIQRVTNCRILYLTARPMNLIKETRAYIEDLQQPCRYTQTNVKLPPGPVITDVTDILGSFTREVIHKTSHIFKEEMLKQLKSCFKKAGRDVVRFPVFIATFGNKQTDVMAYTAAGAPRLTMFLIDTYSTIQVMHGDGANFDTYDDNRLLQTTLERIDLIQSGKLPMPE